MLGQIGRVLLESSEVIEGIDFAQVAGVDQAHKQIPGLGAMFGFVEQSVLPVEYRFFQSPFADVVVQRRIGYPQKGGQLLSVLDHV